MASSTSKVWDLTAAQELRFEVAWDAAVTVVLLTGTCECFGTELAAQQTYKFAGGTKLALFSWAGCKLQLQGECHAYVAGNTPMPAYLSLHNQLETLRSMAKANSSEAGPVIVLCGPVDCGKSTIARILLAYAARLGYTPLYVDLDVGQGAITIPGVVSAVGVEKPPQPCEGLSSPGCSTPPVGFFYGHLSLDKNPSLYKVNVESLAKVVQDKLATNPLAKRSGVIINTCGWIDGLGFELLLHDIEAFNANHVAVIEHERLFHDISERLAPGRPVNVLKLPKSGGVVSRDQNFRRKNRVNRIREYFYGVNGDLCPHSTVLNFSETTIYRIGGNPAAPLSALPIGQTPSQDPVRLVEVTPSSELVHSVIAVMHCGDSAAILANNVAGFLYITNVDFDKRTLTVLAPCPGDLPSRFALVGTVKWNE
eukprot:TRINITY_DN17654_c0_g1_i1.p1 TRINITY_DN17654_c0_g1~~TRINITY_DN17654_c0_g1_i1.p1  ORF type:complete len:431 (-),score=91.94 TRINITY_DN17654_c0_g1_i1:29-1300(-)